MPRTDGNGYLIRAPHHACGARSSGMTWKGTLSGSRSALGGVDDTLQGLALPRSLHNVSLTRSRSRGHLLLIGAKECHARTLKTTTSISHLRLLRRMLAARWVPYSSSTVTGPVPREEGGAHG